MKYLCLVYCEPHVFATLSASEQATLDRDSVGYDDQLRKTGHFIAAAALQSVDTAKTIRVRGGKMSMIDGPFAETKEVLCGFILLEARDQDEAVQIAGKIPMAKLGTIEVRPELDIGGKEDAP